MSQGHEDLTKQSCKEQNKEREREEDREGGGQHHRMDKKSGE